MRLQLRNEIRFANSRGKGLNFKSENFVYIEWSEEKFLKGSVGRQMKLCFLNKCQMTDLLLMQLARYRYVLIKKIKYQFYVLIDFIY